MRKTRTICGRGVKHKVWPPQKAHMRERRLFGTSGYKRSTTSRRLDLVRRVHAS